jgi:hypothetical protein
MSKLHWIVYVNAMQVQFPHEDLECYGSIFGNRLLIISLSFRKIWDALTGDVLHSFEHKHIVRACAFSEVML